MKKSLKKIGLSLCLVGAMGMLAACGGDAGQSAGSGSGQAPAAGDEGKANVTVGIVQFADHGSLDNCREGFIQGLANGGYVEGENLTIEYSNAQADTGIANQAAQQYASNNVNLLCGIATPAAQAAYNAAEAKNIPVIYTAVSDPVAAGLADADGGNVGAVTGTSDALPLEKQVAMIRQLLPEAKTIGILYSTSEVNSETQIALLQEIVPNYGFELVTKGVNSQADVPMALDNLLTQVDCINNLTDNTVVSALSIIIEKATAKGIPVFGSEIEQVKLGCVASESINYINLGIQTGEMAAKVLDGEDIKTLAYETIKESEIVYNSAALEALGMTLPEGFAGQDVAAEVSGE